MKKINSIILSTILLLATGVLFSACSDDDNANDQFSNRTNEVFQHMKNNYSGSITLADGSPKTINVSIADDSSMGTTCVRMDQFPMEEIFGKLNPGDWKENKLDSAVRYIAPIDSGGFFNTNLIFKTDDDKTPEINFSYYDSYGKGHIGWAQVTTTGTYYSTFNVLELTFNVIDLVVDNQDRTGLLPITFTSTMEVADTKK